MQREPVFDLGILHHHRVGDAERIAPVYACGANLEAKVADTAVL